MDGGTALLITARQVERPDLRRADLPAPDLACFRLLSESRPQIVCVVDGTIEDVNPAWVRFSGAGLEETARAG